MLIYIAGPMTGKKHYNFKAFNKAERRLKREGHMVINPVTFSSYYLDGHITKNELLFEELCRLSTAEAIFLLPGWESSEGALYELYTAIKLKIKILTKINKGKHGKKK